jgi:hypothetical protein
MGLKMTYSRMSEAGLARCRALKITPMRDKEGLRYLLEVTDPRFNDKVFAKFVARSEIDLARVRKTYMQQYRIPEQKVTVAPEIDVTPKELEDANRDHRKSPKVHEPRKAVLVFKSQSSDE